MRQVSLEQYNICACLKENQDWWEKSEKVGSVQLETKQYVNNINCNIENENKMAEILYMWKTNACMKFYFAMLLEFYVYQ